MKPASGVIESGTKPDNFETTYQELKLKVFFNVTFKIINFETTYQELKQLMMKQFGLGVDDFETTYQELKLRRIFIDRSYTGKF